MQGFPYVFRWNLIVNIYSFYLIFLVYRDKLTHEQSARAEKEETTMKCKYCEAEMADWGGFCPVCGKKNTEDQEEMLTLEEEISEEVEVSEENEADIAEETEVTKKLQRAKRMAAMSGCIALLAVLATVLFFGIRGGWEVDDLFGWLKPRQNTIHYKDSYTVTDKKAVKNRDEVVATMGEYELTNAQLQIYYWNEVYGFLSNYSYYLSYIGFDYTKALDEQVCYFDNTVTWEQYFISSAIQIWQSNVAFADLAKQSNYQMPEEQRKELDGMEADLQKQVTLGGYASLDAMVEESFGAGITFADYKEYMEVYYLGYCYFEELYEAIDPSIEQLEAYYEANKEALEADGVKKDGTYTVDVRHILVLIDNVVKDMAQENGTDAKADSSAEPTEEHWEACLVAAQKIYDEWLAGEKTEASFGELANQYSDDQKGQVTNGGIYTFVAEGDMVEDFNTWCFTEGRQPGDTGIVKTKFGYHVMYFVGTEEVWLTKTRSAYVSEESDKIVSDALSKFTVNVNYKKIALANVKL